MYDIMDVPDVIALTNPVPEPIVAILVLLLSHEPPLVISVSKEVLPMQSDVGPVIDAGNGFTVIVNVVRQPVANV